jgi:choline dehydrogenase-like flavoprotein
LIFRLLQQPDFRIVLGGSSAINAMCTIYPDPKMFDIWTELGNKGWDASTMAQYYRKFETFHPPKSELEAELSISTVDTKLHGHDGPVQTSISNFTMSVSRLWNKTFEGLGMKATSDQIAGQASGSFISPNYIDPKTSTRSHAGVAYYEPIRLRPNVTLLSNAMVEKVLFSLGQTGEKIATGVQVSVAGKSRVIDARKEVILAAGAFNSPALLELSGIGNPGLLDSLGIDVVLPNANVGENLQDHTMCMMTFETVKPEDSLDSLRDPLLLQHALQQYTEHQTGPMSCGFNAMSLLPVIRLLPESDIKEYRSLFDTYLDPELLAALPKAQRIQYEYLRAVSLDPDSSTAYISGAPLEIFPEPAPQETTSMSIVCSHVHPFSRGSSHITSKDPSEQPAIDPRYLSHPLDLEILARHILYLPKLAAAEPLASVVKQGGRQLPERMDNLDDAKAWTKQGTHPQYHPCGTCAMMPYEMGGVVNDRLVVHGTTNLRVVDASVFPMIPKGPITSSVYAVAEKAADIIKEDLKLKT